MAIINCQECGKEISDTAVSCPHCGYNYRSFPKLLKRNKKRIIIGILLLIIILSSVCAFVIFSRPDLEMDDFKVDNGKLETLFLLGPPSSKEGNEWEYEECGISFYDIPVKQLWYNIDEGEYYLLFDPEHNEELISIVSKYCELKDVISGFYVYTYGDIEVWLSLYSTSGNMQIHK